MKIRPLNSADAEIFQTLRLRALQDAPAAFASSYEEECTIPLAVVAERLSPKPGRVVLGAFHQTFLVGIIGLASNSLNKQKHKAFVWGMYVAPEARSAGVGRSLLNELLKVARSLPQLRQISLSVNADNAAAIHLYESAGFSIYGREMGALAINDRYHDELHMCLALVES